MKKLICTAVVAITALFSLLAFAGCKKPPKITVENEYLGTSDESLKVEGMSAYEMFAEAYSNWLAEDGYRREAEIAFSLFIASNIVGTRSALINNIVEGDRIYSQEMSFGDGFAKGMTYASKYYFDGTDAYYLKNENKKDVAYSDGKFTVKNWGEFTPYNDDVAAQNALVGKRWTVYNTTDDSFLASSHNDSVYKVNDTYYFTIVIDCGTEALAGVQADMKAEYVRNMEATASSFWMENTVIDVAVRYVDGKLRFTEWLRKEKYGGKARDLMDVTCEETCYEKLFYDNCGIEDDDLLNLA